MKEAERLAEALTKAVQMEEAEDDAVLVARWFVEDSAAELRRLSAIKAELEDLVKDVWVQDESMNFMGSDWHKQSIKALEKARQ